MIDLCCFQISEDDHGFSVTDGKMKSIVDKLKYKYLEPEESFDDINQDLINLMTENRITIETVGEFEYALTLQKLWRHFVVMSGDLRGAILRMSDGECKCLGETSVLNGMNLLVSARLFNLRARTLLVLTLELPAKKHEATSSVSFMDALSGLNDPRAFFWVLL